MTYKFMVRGYNPPVDEADNQPDWILGFAGSSGGAGKYGYAQNTDRTSWTLADYKTSQRRATFSAAVGKNASGDGIYVLAQKLGTHQNQLAVSGNDITDGNLWTEVSLVASSNSNDTVQKILWAADSGGSTAGVWMAGTGNGQLFRSTDGAANWSELTKGAGQLPTNWETDGGDRKIVRSMASNGTGQWVIVQDTRIFVSTNDGATFSEVSHGISNIQVIFGIVYTNNSYVIVYDRDDDNKLRVRSAASSDLTTWSSEVSYSPMVFPDGSAGEIKHVRMAADSSGRVVFISPDKQGVGYLNVNGTTISNNGLLQAMFSNNPSRDIATNGAGVWLVTCEDGTIFESTNNGTSWTEIVGDDPGAAAEPVPDASTNINCIASNYYLPLQELNYEL